MKALPWLIAGVGIGLTIFLVNQPGARYATGTDEVEDAGDEVAICGSKQRVAGTGRGLVGKLKKSVGHVAGDDALAGAGAVDQCVGGARDVAGQVAQAVGETIHDLD